MENAQVAKTVEHLAALLEAQKANPFRVQAWRAGAEKIRSAKDPLALVVTHEGLAGLQRDLSVGTGIAAALQELLLTGRLRMLERLEGHNAPEDLFLTVPGIGPTLAGAVHHKYGIETLEELEAAALDGRLAKVPGFGARRVKLVQEAVDGMLRHSMRARYRMPERRFGPPAEVPLITTLLDVDREYVAKSAAGALPRIAPRRFNPKGEAWMPVLHTEANDWNFTALFSNTARAHRLGRTRDWVVIYFEREGQESQATVVTEVAGPLMGRRVVRGREAECAAYYGAGAAQASA
jgi:DNA polymerase (family 10)